MKKQRILIIGLVLILLIGMLSACVPVEQTYEYTQARSFSCLNYMNTGRDVEETGGNKTRTASAEYFFAGGIEETDRNAFVNAQEKIFSHLTATGLAENDVFLTVYVLQNCQGFARKEAGSPLYNPMFLASIDDTGTHTQVLLTLQAIYGEMTNYGLLYGLSNIIAESLKFESGTADEPTESLKNFWETPENQPLFDLTYPCFIEPYATEKETDIVKQTSNNLAAHIYNKDNGKTLKQLLTKDFTEFEEEFAFWKNTWLKSVGSDLVLTARELPVTFAYGGRTYPLVFKTSRVLYAITNDYVDLYSDVYGKDYMQSDYATLVNTIQILESEMNDTAAKLEDSNYNYGLYSVVFSNQGSGEGNAGFYYGSQKRSYLRTVSVALHEYIHHLTIVYYNTWTWETIAYYYGYTSYFSKYLDYMRFKYLAQDMLAICEMYLDREYEVNDSSVIGDIIILLFDQHRNTFDGSDYLVGFVFGNYLVAQYGEEALIKLYTSHCDSPESITGKSWQELQDGWIDWLENEYGYLRDLVEIP